MGMREKYQSLALADLKEIAKSRGIKGTSGMKKADIIDAMVALDEKEEKNRQPRPKQRQRKRQRKNPGLLMRQKKAGKRQQKRRKRSL